MPARVIEALQCPNQGCDCRKARLGKGHVHCPAHEDSDPSLSITEKGGKLLVRCHAGCEQDSVVEALRDQGLWMKRGHRGARRTRQTRKDPIRYEVRDPGGCLAAVHVRIDGPNGKSMWWERPDGRIGLEGVATSALPLYGSETLGSLANGAPVVVTEGEKAADALRSKGIAAVGTVTGAGGTPGDDALGPLVRLGSLLWADNDDPGTQHMTRIKAKLTRLGCQDIRSVEWADAPPAGDAADAVAMGVDINKLLTEAKSWEPVDVDLSGLLNDVASFIRQYVVLTECQLWTLALWTAHTYVLEAAECTPYIRIQSAEKRSGKTLLLEVLSLVVARPWSTGRVTAAVLVRKITKDMPTLLLDETDAAFKGDKEYGEALRGILNSGYRRGGVVSLCVKAGADFDLRDFPVFGAKAFAGIGRLPDTVQDRSIPIEMCRKAKNEHAKRFRMRDAVLEAGKFGGSLDGWSVSAIPILERVRPDIPEELGDRAADVWEPLLAIADMAGGNWPDQAREAASTLSAKGTLEDFSQGVNLLKDIREVFIEKGSDRLSSATLITALLDMEEAPWGDLHGRPLDARRMARTLKPYGIKPVTIRLPDGSTPKGYLKSDFADSWNRYLPVAATSATTATNLSLGTPDVADVADR